MAHKVFYEWLVEELSEDGDIVDVNHFATYAQAVKFSESFGGGALNDIGLVRDVCDTRDEGLIERSWAYIEDGKPPEVFENGRAVPKRFVQEVLA